MTAMHKCFAKAPNMRVKALQKVYEIMCGSKFMYGDGICWLEGWKVSKRVADGVLPNQLIQIIITIIIIIIIIIVIITATQCNPPVFRLYIKSLLT
jgi:hypothetical protein